MANIIIIFSPQTHNTAYYICTNNDQNNRLRPSFSESYFFGHRLVVTGHYHHEPSLLQHHHHCMLIFTSLYNFSLLLLLPQQNDIHLIHSHYFSYCYHYPLKQLNEKNTFFSFLLCFKKKVASRWAWSSSQASRYYHVVGKEHKIPSILSYPPSTHPSHQPIIIIFALLCV